MASVDIEFMIQEGLTLAVLDQFYQALGQLQFLTRQWARIHRENLERKALKSWNIEDCNTPTYSHNPMECGKL